MSAASSPSTTGRRPLYFTTKAGHDINLDNLPKLKGECNYYLWAGTWRRILNITGTWEVVNGDTKQPPDEESVRLNAQAHTILTYAVAEDILPTVVFADSANAAWKALKDRYECKLPITTLLGTVLDTKMEDDGSIPDHIQAFHSNWTRLAHKCQSADDSLAKALKSATASDEVKAAFLLASLPRSMGDVVGIIQLGQDATYEDAREQLLSDAAQKECSWCRKRRLAYRGHHYTECGKLKAKKKEKMERRSRGL